MLASARRRGWLPTNTALTTADLLAFINEEARTRVVSLIKSCREEYLVREANHDVTVISGTAQYRIPDRCVGGALRTVKLVDGDSVTPLTRVEPEREHEYSGTGTPVGYMLRGGVIELKPAPSGSSTLRLTYLMRLNNVVETSSVARITAINTGTNVVTVSSPPSTFTTTTSGSPIYDLVRGKPGFETLAIDQSFTKSGSNYTCSTTLPAELAVGDYLCLAGEAPFLQLPVECQPVVAQAVTLAIAEAVGSPRAGTAAKTLERMEKDLRQLLTPRVTGSTRPVVNPYAPGMRGRRAWRW